MFQSTTCSMTTAECWFPTGSSHPNDKGKKCRPDLSTQLVSVLKTRTRTLYLSLVLAYAINALESISC